MTTHGDLVTSGDQLVMSENLIATGQYLVNLKRQFKGVSMLLFHWDPASYDCSTLVAIVYSHAKDIACYPPIQNITPLLKQDVDLELQKLASRNRLTRIDGYTELRALSHCMRSLGCPLDFFLLDSSIHWEPLTIDEYRVFRNGKLLVFNKTTGKK